MAINVTPFHGESTTYAKYPHHNWRKRYFSAPSIIIPLQHVSVPIVYLKHLRLGNSYVPGISLCFFILLLQTVFATSMEFSMEKFQSRPGNCISIRCRWARAAPSRRRAYFTGKSMLRKTVTDVKDENERNLLNCVLDALWLFAVDKSLNDEIRFIRMG